MIFGALILIMIVLIGVTDYIEINSRSIRNKFNKEKRKEPCKIK